MSKKRKVVRIVASVVAAIAIWLYVDTVKMPSVPMKIRDIPVEFSGENTTLADKGLMLLSGYDTTVDLTLKGPRTQLYKMKKSDVRIVADTSSITESGAQTLTYQVIYPDGVAKNSISVSWASVYSVTVTVGELYSKEISVRCEVSGEPQKGYFADEPILDTETITLYGLRENLLNISYAKISVDISGSDTSYKNAESFTLYDNNDVRVDNDAIRLATKLVQVDIPIKTTKEVPLELLIQETPGSTLEQISYSILPKSVTIAGEKDVLAKINTIVLDTVYLQDIEENQTLYYAIPLPDKTELKSTEEGATVTFTMKNVEEKTVTVKKFVTERVPSGFSGTCTSGSIQVTLRGVAGEIAAVTDADLTAIIDFSELKSAGEYTVPVTILVSNFNNISAKGTYHVNVKLDSNG